MPFRVLFLALLGSLGAHAAEPQYECGGCETWKWNTPVRQLPLTSFGKGKSKGKQTRWTLPNHSTFSITEQGANLASLYLRFASPQDRKKFIPEGAQAKNLIEIPTQSKTDVRGVSRWIAQPATGQMWEVDFTDKVVAYRLTKPWEKK